MSSFSRRAGRWAAAFSVAALVAACQDSITVDGPAPSSARAAQVAEAGATVAWNGVARDLVKKYGTSAPATIRLFAILSVAQYNALVDAEQGDDRVAPVDRARRRCRRLGRRADVHLSRRGDVPRGTRGPAGSSADLARRRPGAVRHRRVDRPHRRGERDRARENGPILRAVHGNRAELRGLLEGHADAARVRDARPGEAVLPRVQLPVPSGAAPGVRFARVPLGAGRGPADRRHAHDAAGQHRQVLGAAGGHGVGAGLLERDGLGARAALPPLGARDGASPGAHEHGRVRRHRGEPRSEVPLLAHPAEPGGSAHRARDRAAELPVVSVEPRDAGGDGGRRCSAHSSRPSGPGSRPCAGGGGLAHLRRHPLPVRHRGRARPRAEDRRAGRSRTTSWDTSRSC